MAEAIAVVGLIASILGIIDGIDVSKKTWNKYLHTSSSLRAELLPILGKLTAFAGILRGLQLQFELDDADADRLCILEHVEKPLRASEQSVRLISARLDQFVSIGRVSLTFGKLLNKETTAALHLLDQSKAVLDLALAADQRTLVKSIENYVRNVAEHLRDARFESKLYYEGLKDQLSEINTRNTESLHLKTKADILAWISQINYSSSYHAARQLMQQTYTSGDWFIDSETFRDWLNGGRCSGLLLTGISGCGKTVLCARAIDHVARVKTASGDDPFIFYFFFDFNDAAKESVEGMVRVLLYQIVARLEVVPDSVRNLYTNHQSSISTKPSISDWVNLLCSLLASIPNAFIFIDAMDECTEADLVILRSTLATLFAKPHENVRWLLTCRPNGLTLNDLNSQSFSHVEMKAEQVDRDIEKFLSTALKIDPKLSSFSKEARECIITEIKSKSCGMFRYAQCQLASIAKLRDRRVRKVKDTLRAMPQDLFDIYRRTLSEAQKLDDWPISQRILILVSFSARPVTVAEVAEFAVLEDGMASLDTEDRIDVSDIVFTINPLITVRDGIMALAHKSVQEFLETDLVHLVFNFHQSPDSFIAGRCLQYLRFAQKPVVDIPEARELREPNASQLNKLLHEYPFLDYAASRWAYHLRDIDLQRHAMGDMAGTLPLNSKPNLWKAWLLLQRADIWENQIQLARLLCESFIRGSLVTGWSDNFWQQRQSYRVRNNAESQSPPKPVLSAEKGQLKIKRNNSTSVACAKSYFWVQAMADQPLGRGTDIDSVNNYFRQGDLIFIQNTPNDIWWEGFFGGRIVWVQPSKVKRCISRANIQIAGTLFHDLAILLLEVAFQASFFADVSKLWTTLSSKAALARYLLHLKVFNNRVTDKMGSQYGKVVSRCLSKVRWLDDHNNTTPDLRDLQDEAMMELCKPLEMILSAGYRASRTPLKHVSRSLQQLSSDVSSLRYAPSGKAMSIAAYRSARNSPSVASVPYRATASIVSYGSARNSPSAASEPSRATSSIFSYGLARYDSPKSEYDRAASVEAKYLTGTTVVSNPATTVSSTASPIVEDLSLMSVFTTSRGFSASWYKIVSLLYPTNTLSPFVLATAGPGPVMSTATALHRISLPILSNVVESEGKENSNKITVPIKGRSTADAKEPLAWGEMLATIHERNLTWEFPDRLGYNPFSETAGWPRSIAPNDNQIEATLEAAREAAVSSNDSSIQLLWARDTLVHVSVAEYNRNRASEALSVGDQYRQASDVEAQLRESAIAIIECLADKGHPEAVYVKAKWSEIGQFGCDVDQKSCFEGFKFASTNGCARAWYWMGSQYETSNNVVNAMIYYNKGAKAYDAAALYRMGMMRIMGEYGQTRDINHGLEILYKAAENADDEAPHALYTLGMIHAHKMPQLRIPDDVVALDKKSAVRYLQRAAGFGLAKAQLELGSAYELGELGLEFNLPFALHYYILAARRGEAAAEMSISRIMRHLRPAIGKLTDSIEYTYAKRAAMDDLPLAQYTLGYCHEHGIHVATNLEKAREWYGKAAAKGNQDALTSIDNLEAANVESENVQVPPADDRPDTKRKPEGEVHIFEPAELETDELVLTQAGKESPRSIPCLPVDTRKDNLNAKLKVTASAASIEQRSRRSRHATLDRALTLFKKKKLEGEVNKET